MSVVCKLFIQSATEQPDGSRTYQLGAVCRGEENKTWAAATPSGSMKSGPDPLLDLHWREKQAGRGPGEIEVFQTPDPEGGWIMDRCDFSYGGCAVKFRQTDKPWGSLELTINATGATKVLREAYAAALLEGNAPRFRLDFDSPR